MKRRKLLLQSLATFFGILSFPVVAQNEKENQLSQRTKKSLFIISAPEQMLSIPHKIGAKFSDYIYIGKIGSNPKFKENQISVYTRNEDGQIEHIGQPVKIDGNGYPSYRNQSIFLFCNETYSITICNLDNHDILHYPNIKHINLDLINYNISSLSNAQNIQLEHGKLSDAIKFITPQMFNGQIKTAHDYATNNGLQLIFPAGNYIIEGWKDISDKAINWQAQGEVTIEIHKTPLEFESTKIELKLAGDSLRDQNLITVMDTGKINIGSICIIKAEEIVDIRRREKIKRTIATVVAVTKNKIKLDENLFFDHSELDKNAQIYVYNQPRQINISGIKFINAIDSKTSARTIVLTGIKNSLAFQNCNFSALNRNNDGFYIQESANIMAKNIFLQGLRYGAMYVTSKDCGVNEISGFSCRHLVYSAYWAIRTTFTNIKGYDNTATADSHSAFETKISNLVANNDTEVSNNRSYGAICENWDVKIKSFLNKKKGALCVFTISNQVWVEGYRNRYKNFGDVSLKNIKISAHDGSLPNDKIGLVTTGGRNLTISNVYIGDGLTELGAKIAEIDDTFRTAIIDCSNVIMAYNAVSSRCRTFLSINRGLNFYGSVDAKFINGKYLICPFYMKNNGNLKQSKITSSGIIPVTVNSDDLQNKQLDFNLIVLDNMNPFGAGKSQSNITIGKMHIKMMHTDASAQNDEKLSSIDIVWKHTFRPHKFEIIKSTALTPKLSNKKKNNILIKDITPTTGSNEDKYIFNDSGIEISLSLRNLTAKNIFKVVYELELNDINQPSQ